MSLEKITPTALDYYGQHDAVAAGMVRMTKLAACLGCGSVHPWARAPMIETDRCPECGLRVAAAEVRFTRMHIKGLPGFVVDAFYGIADHLQNLAERLHK